MYCNSDKSKESSTVKVFQRPLPLLLVFFMQFASIAPAFSQKVEMMPSETKIKQESPQQLIINKVQLLSGTKIKLELAQELSSKKSKTGEEVIYYVSEDVLSPNQEVLIRKGARAFGKITEAKRAAMFGRKGKLQFTVEEVEAIDGTKVPLRSTVNKEGKNQTGTMVAVTALVSVFGVFIRGRNITIDQGTVVEAYVDSNAAIAVSKL